MYVHLQQTLSSKETIKAKAFKHKVCKMGVRIKHYHIDKGHFAENVFCKHVRASGHFLLLRNLFSTSRTVRIQYCFTLLIAGQVIFWFISGLTHSDMQSIFATPHHSRIRSYHQSISSPTQRCNTINSTFTHLDAWFMS